MQNETNPVSIRFSDEFEEKLYRLSKKYRLIRSDVQAVIEEIQRGNFLGVGQQPVAQPSPDRNG